MTFHTESQTVFNMKRSAAGAVKANFNKFMEKEFFSITDVEEVLRLFFIDDDIIRSWYSVINRLRKQHDYKLPESLEYKFREDANSQFAKKCTYELDPTARLLVMGATDMYDDVNYFMRFPDCLISNFKKTGTYGCIEGVPRTGKTSLACSLMEVFNDTLEMEVLTNIAIKDPPSYIHVVKKLSELVQLMDETKRWVCILDETGTFVGRKRALSKENIDFENLARFIGKMDGRLIMITHSFKNDVPTTLQDWITERYKKLDVDRAYIKLMRVGGYIKMNRTISGIPDANLKYITEDITSLEFDISIKKLLEDVQNKVSVKQALESQLSQKKDSKKEQIIKLLKKGNMQQKDIAKTVGVDQSLVAYYKKKARLT